MTNCQCPRCLNADLSADKAGAEKIRIMKTPEWMNNAAVELGHRPPRRADVVVFIRAFAAEVNRRAEEAMVAAGERQPLAHRRAMLEVLKEIES